MEPPDDELAPAPGGAAWRLHDDREHALDLWRGGERLLRRKLTPGWVTDYAHAVTLALAQLQRYTTLDELARVYFDDSHAADPDDWLATACHTQSGRVLNQGIVEDAAYWRRAQQLIAAVAE
jgi:hypothetical protein